MAGPRSSLGAVLGRRLHDPLGMLREGWSRAPEAALLVLAAIPRRIRRPLLRPVARAAEWTATHAPQRGLPQLAFITRWAAGSSEAAADLATRLGTAPATAAGSRRDLAALALAVGRPDVAGGILESIPTDTSARADAVRASILFARGRYTESIAAGRRAVAAGRAEAAPALRLAESRLRVLEPGWGPDLGTALGRLERLRALPPTPGRILHLGSVSLPYRQVGYTLRSQAVALAQRGVGLDPHFATRAGFPATEGILHPAAEDVVDGITYHRLAPAFRDARFDDQLVTTTALAAVPLLERLGPAALQPASNHLQAQVALALGRPLGIPVVYEVRGFLEETWASLPGQDEAEAVEADRYRLSRAAETRAMLAASAVVTLSETMRADIIERGVDPENVVVVPNAVDVDRFQPVPRDESLAASLGIAPGEGVVGYISTLSPYEGIPYLLEAAALLRSRGRGIRVVLVGEGRERGPIEEAAHRLGLDDGTLVMAGRVPHADIRRWYSLLDVFVVPRTANRVSRLVTPLKPYEAMAMERPLVVSDVPALREIIRPGETGMTFRAEDADDLAGVLAGLLDDPALRVRLGRAAREWVAAERTWPQNGRRYQALYERLGVA